MLTERGELHVRKGRFFMDWLPPIEVSRISDGGKVRPHKELFRMVDMPIGVDFQSETGAKDQKVRSELESHSHFGFCHTRFGNRFPNTKLNENAGSSQIRSDGLTD